MINQRQNHHEGMIRDSVRTTGQVAFNSSETKRLRDEASRLEETLLYAGNDDSLNRSQALQNAVKQVTDPLMMSDLLKTTT